MSFNPYDNKFHDEESTPDTPDEGAHNPNHEKDMPEEKGGSAQVKRTTKSVAEQLEDVERRARQLRAKLARRRDKDRVTLVGELYGKHGIEAIQGDLDESKRLTKLKEVLGL